MNEPEGEEYFDRDALLEPVITRVVDALGGYEGGVYRMGDEVTGCLKDLKMLWRKDDTDDERTVARIFWKTRVLPNDLIPILLETAGKGLVEDKRAILCADLITAMTWPIDLAEELKELDDELDRGTDYTQLLESHLHYKAALLKPGVIQALFGIMVPPLAKPAKQRKERDGQIVNVVLHLIRNLAFIKDLPVNMHLSADQAELSSLQTKFIRALSETHTLRLLLTIAANTENDPMLNSWNTLVLEIFYLLFRGIRPASLATDQTKQPAQHLQSLLAAEARQRHNLIQNANTRHSRFGTTIAVKLNPNKKPPTPAAAASASTNAAATGNAPSQSSNIGQSSASASSSAPSKSFVLHRQQAISREAGSIMDMRKQPRAKKGNKVDELSREDNLSVEARVILQNLAIEFVEACFNPFLSALLKDIRSERIKITEKDNLRLLFVTKWFLDFFLTMRSNEKAKGKDGSGVVVATAERWGFGLIAEVTERSWIIWVLKRMREAVEEKPKLWTELQAGIECLTQLLLLIDNMSMSDITDSTLREAADILQQQLIYNGEVLDIAIESLRSYKQGTQSLAYLDSSVYLAYALLKMLERWSKGKGGSMYVRQKKGKRRTKMKGTNEEIPDDVDEENEEDDEVIHETMFTFEAFEMKFANVDVTHTLLAYLARYKEFTSADKLKRVVSLMHRQAVKAKAEGLFFNVSTLTLFKTLLADQNSFPREQPYKDLVNLINYILRQFFKALAERPFLAVEAFFPKNRGHWKQFSSWEAGSISKKTPIAEEDPKVPQEVAVKKGYSWSDQVGIAIATLVEADQKDLVTWTTEILSIVINERKRVIEEIDGDNRDSDGGGEGDDGEEGDGNGRVMRLQGPSKAALDALERMKDRLIPYTSDEQETAATQNPHLKLLFRLCKFAIKDQDTEADVVEWVVPSSIPPADLQRSLNVINQFLETPFDLQGKKASEYLSKPRRRRRRRSPSPVSDAGSLLDDDNDSRRKKREKKKKEKEVYKSAQFIEDSDEEYGDMDAFLEKEKAIREQTMKAAEALGHGLPPNMKPTGTKKRRRNTKEGTGNKKHKGDKGSSPAAVVNLEELDQSGASSDSSASRERESDNDLTSRVTPEPEKTRAPTRPKPRPRLRKATVKNGEGEDSARQSTSVAGFEGEGAPPSEFIGVVGGNPEDDEGDEEHLSMVPRKKNRLIVTTSDDDDDED